MFIAPTAASNTLATSQSPAVGSTRFLQSVFSEVLAASGREGFASAVAIETDEPLETSLQTAWSSWFDGPPSQRDFGDIDPEQLKQGFGEILARAHSEGGYVDPQSFVKSLSKEELATIQQVHLLARPIGVDELTEEGALNLLLPPAAGVDLNHDGLTQSGIGYRIGFPDSTTPSKVVAAWDEATANLEPGDKMMYELQMKLPLLLANMYVDAQGQYSHHYEPGDPEFRNPLLSGGYSFLEATQSQIDNLDFMKHRMEPSLYQKHTNFWNHFQQLLSSHGAK